MTTPTERLRAWLGREDIDARTRIERQRRVIEELLNTMKVISEGRTGERASADPSSWVTIVGRAIDEALDRAARLVEGKV